MAENLFLRVTDQAIEWMLLDETSGIVRFRGHGETDEFANLVAEMNWSGNTYVMLHGEEVLLTNATLPTKQQRQVLRAVPFMVEESLASDVDECHFAIGERDADGSVSVAVINDKRMRHWMDFFANAGISPQIVTVDTLSIPMGEAACTIMLDGPRALVRQGEMKGLVVPSAILATTIDLLPDDEKQNLSLQVHETQYDETQLTVSQVNVEQDITIDVFDLEYLPFEALCRGFNRHSINLLQGDYKIEAPKYQNDSNWRNVAILAAVAFGLQITLLLGQGVYLDLKAMNYEAEARALYKDIYPNDRNVTDLRRRWKAHIGQGSGGTEGQFLSLFAETAKNIPGSNLQLNNVNFNESRGDLVLQLETVSREQLILFSETLGKLGLDANIGTINQGDGLVRGSIKVRALAGS